MVLSQFKAWAAKGRAVNKARKTVFFICGLRIRRRGAFRLPAKRRGLNGGFGADAMISRSGCRASTMPRVWRKPVTTMPAGRRGGGWRVAGAV